MLPSSIITDLLQATWLMQWHGCKQAAQSCMKHRHQLLAFAMMRCSMLQIMLLRWKLWKPSMPQASKRWQPSMQLTSRLLEIATLQSFLC